MELTEFDKELIGMTDIPESVLQKVKDIFGLPIYQYFGYSDEELDYIPMNGVCVLLGIMELKGSEIRAYVKKLNDFLKAEGLPFAAFGSEYFIKLEDGEDCVAIVPDDCDFPALKYAGTAGFDAKISNGQIADKLSSWKHEFDMDFQLIYADMQQIDAEFIRKPQNLKALADAIDDFAPDLVDRLDNREEDLIRIMQEDNIFSLFWE